MEVANRRLLPTPEGVLLLQQMSSLSCVPWFSNDLKQLLKRNSDFSAAEYVERSLLQYAVTSMDYAPLSRGGLPRRPLRLPRDIQAWSPATKEIDVEEQTEGFWKVKEVIGFIPPWEAFCNQRCGLYQDFYLVLWDQPLMEMDYSSLENGSEEVPGATWECDECLPLHWDDKRYRLKMDWVARCRVKQKMADLDRSQKEWKKRRRSQTPERFVSSKTPRRDAICTPPEAFLARVAKSPGAKVGTPPWPSPGTGRLHPSGYWMSSGTQKDLTIRERPKPNTVDRLKTADEGGSAQPKPNSAAGSAQPEVVHILNPITCVDDIVPEKCIYNRSVDEAEAKKAADNFIKQRSIVRVHDNKGYKGDWPHYTFIPCQKGAKPQQKREEHFGNTALKIEEHIRTTLMFLPPSSLSGLRIPPLGCLSLKSHRPDFQLRDAPALLGLRRDGLLEVGETNEGSEALEEASFSIQQIYEDECDVAVDCAVRNGLEKHWIFTTHLVVLSIKSLVAKDLSPSDPQKVWERLQQQLMTIYDFETKEPRDLPLSEWMSCVSSLLQMLRTLSMIQQPF